MKHLYTETTAAAGLMLVVFVVSAFVAGVAVGVSWSVAKSLAMCVH